MMYMLLICGEEQPEVAADEREGGCGCRALAEGDDRAGGQAVRRPAR